ncbi:MAG: thioredoxin domain-containing protein [Chloroflexota bacterium]
MMKRYALLLVMIGLLLSAISLMAQEATPEATPEPDLAATAEATMEIPQNISELFASLPQTRQPDGGFVVGQPDAPITVIEFIDYACPHCQDYRPVIDQVLMQYLAAGEMKYELRLFPTAGGQTSYFVDQFAECAEKQRKGTFWQAYDLLYGYATSGQYDLHVGEQMAKFFKLDYDKMVACVDGAKQVGTDVQLGIQLGVTGTPAVMVRLGDEEPQFITAGGRTYDAGGVPLDVLTQLLNAANGIEMTPEPDGQSVLNFGTISGF